MSPRSRYYPDIILFLVIIPFISAFNYYLTYTNIQLNGFLLLTFSIDTVQGYIAWWGVRAFIIYLDKKMPYERGLIRRLVIQLPGTLLIGLLIISVLTELVSWIARGKPVPLDFYLIDLFIISIWFFVINGIYLGLYYYRLWRESETLRQREQQVKSEGILVSQGRQQIRLTFDRVTGFYVDGEYAVVCDQDGKKYYLNQSLDKIEQKLPAAFFYRLNRQYILHRHAISGFKRLENGKLLVTINSTGHFPSEIQVSRIKAPSFKEWFRPE